MEIPAEKASQQPERRWRYWPRRSISRDLTVSLVAMVMLASAATIAIDYVVTTREDAARLEQKADEFLSYLMQTLELPLWNIDEEGVAKIGTAFSSNELVAGLRIAETGGAQMFGHGRVTGRELVIREGVVRHGGRPIGRITIALTPLFYKERHRQLLRSSLLTLVVGLLMLAAVTGFLLRVFLRAPLEDLLQGIERISAGAYDSRLRKQGRHEVETIMARFNEMARQVEARDKSLNRINQRLEVEITQHEKAELALSDSEERYRTLFENSPISLWEEDFSRLRTHLDGLRDQNIEDFERYFTDNPAEVERCARMIIIRDINQATVELYEAESKEALLGNLGKILPARARHVLKEEMVTVAAGSMFELETVNRTLAGRELQVLIKAAVPPGYEQTWSRVYISVLDLTRRVEAERALKESEEKFATAFMLSPDAILITSMQGRIIECNRSFLQIMGHAREEAIGRTTAELNHWSRAEDLERFEQALRDSGEVGNMETTFRTSDGRQLPGLISARSIEFRGEQRIISIIRDMSGLRKAEAERQRLALVIEQANEAVIIMDTEGRILYVNPAFEIIYGLEMAEATGRLLKPQEAEHHGWCLPEGAWRQVAAGGVWKGQLQGKTEEGRDYEVEATLSPVLDGAGKVVNYLSVQRDITREVELERRLRQSEKMDSIGTLAGGIAHDFNNILAALIGYTELSLADAPEGGRQHENLQEALRAGERARDLVKQILTFSRQTEHQRKPMQIAPVIKEALKLLRSSLPTTIAIRSDIAADLENVMADPTQIQQIIMNLGTNAAHAMEKSGGVLAVSLQSEQVDRDFAELHPGMRPGRYLRLTVSDTGQGIARETIGSIFDPYFTTKEKGKGTGLGLAVVHGIVKGYQGEITVRSAPGWGTSFDIYLPAIPRIVEPERVVQPVPRGTEHILVVDDEPALAEMGQRRLENLGYRVEARTSSEEALELFRNDPRRFDLVLTDMTMPNMTGDQLARRMLDVRPDLPIILCTGYSMKISEEQARQVGIRAFVMKPLVLSDLAQTIRKVLDKTDPTD